MTKIWHKKGSAQSDEFNERFLISKGTPDNTLIPYDIRASKAHATMLAKIDVLTEDENTSLQAGLDTLLQRYKSGEFTLSAEDEDCHSAIERFLIDTCGDAGKKIHTGRSRNDQVLVATRLLMKDKLAQTRDATLSLAKNFLEMAQTHEHIPFPGYTHSQQAMLSSLGHYFASFVESLLDDATIQSLAYTVIDQNPLGSAAGFGVAFPLDRKTTTEALGFDRLQQNSLYCQTSRGKFESLVLESLVQVMLTLGRFAQDMIIFTTQEFDYFDVDDSMTTGSSIMPQKKNLDYMEVLRGQVSLVISFQHQVQDLTKNQLSGYNKDLKFVKKAVLEAFDSVSDSLEIARRMLSATTPKPDSILAKISPGIFAADVANELVKTKNIPFRDAYKEAIEQLPDVSGIDLLANLNSKVSLGAPGNLGLEEYRKRLAH